MKKILYLFLFTAQIVFAQKSIQPTDHVLISGLVEKPIEITYDEILKAPSSDLGTIKITNYAGETKKELQNVKGVLLLHFLKNEMIKSPHPKELSQYYLVFKASDGYSFVASWNEIFNTEIGNSFYFITEVNGTTMKDSNERILLMAIKDFQTGRRHIKGLVNIEIKRI